MNRHRLTRVRKFSPAHLTDLERENCVGCSFITGERSDRCCPEPRLQLGDDSDSVAAAEG